ncbi:MAG: hypothetical protein U0Y10_20890 [Spirosomataceae bacterium]
MGLPPDVGLPEEPRRRNRQAPCIPALSERKTESAQEPKKAPHQASIRGFAAARENQRRLGDGLPERVGDGGQTAERANHKRGGRVLEKRPLGGSRYEHHRPQTGGNPRQDWSNEGLPRYVRCDNGRNSSVKHLLGGQRLGVLKSSSSNRVSRPRTESLSGSTERFERSA